MKKIIFIGLLTCIVQLHAQTVTFSRQVFYKFKRGGQAWNVLMQTADNGYVASRILKDSITSTPYDYIELIKTDEGGNLSWSKRILLGTSTVGLGISSVGTGSSLQTYDKGYLVAASIYKTNVLSVIALLKTDSMANVVWSKKYPGEGASTAYCVTRTIDKGYVVCGNTTDGTNKQYAYIFKIDAGGNYTWGRKCLFDSTDTVGSFYTVAEMPGLGYAAAGFSGTHGLAAKFDLNGNLVWDKCLSTVSSNLYSVINTSDNAIIFGGQVSDFLGSNGSRGCFLKFNQSGDTLWTKGLTNPNSVTNYYSEIWSMQPVLNNFVFSGYIQYPIPSMLLGKMDLNGNVIWSKGYRYSSESFGNTPTSLVTTTDGGFMVSSLTGIIRYGIAAYTMQFTKTDSLGNVSCDGSSQPLFSGSLNYTLTSGAVISSSGSVVSYTPTLSNSTVTDTVICENPSYLSIETVGANPFMFQIYPNPNNGSFIIETNATTKQTMQVYDVNGKMVLSQTINGKTSIDAGSLSEGVYNISIINNEGVINKRLVIVGR